MTRKAFFEYVHLSAIKIIVSFKTTKKRVEVQIDPRRGFGLLTVVRNVFGTVANISESPLYFKELILTQSF
jgi:vacuolar protein sorting-associated protein 13A/C